MKRLLFLSMILTLLLVACGNSDKDKEIQASNKEGNVTENDTVEDNDSEKESESIDEKEEVDIYSDEVKEFINNFNNLAPLEENIEPIDNVELAEEVDIGYSQTLFSSSEYIISALYEDEGEARSYIVMIPASEPYQELKGNGIYGTMHVAATLDLDIGEFVEEFEKALPTHAGMYFPEGYAVTFHTNEDVPEMGIVTMFMKSSIGDEE